MRIAEIYSSIQGEGRYTGTPSVFIRTTGCNLRCWFCDTPFTSWDPEGEQISWEAVVDRVLAFEIGHVVLTGGEPLLQRDVVPLVTRLNESGKLLTIETAGTVFRPVHVGLVSISPKLASSRPRGNASGRSLRLHERGRERPDVIRQLIECGDDYQLKFVLDQPADFGEVAEFLQQLPEVPRAKVWLMPQGVTRAELALRMEWISELAAAEGMQACPRRHIELFGHARGV